MCLAYTIGHISGGHMNPGVTLLMFLKRQISATRMGTYMVCQFIGAMLGSAMVWGSTSGVVLGLPDSDITTPPFYLGSTTKSEFITVGNAFLLELMGSFVFFFVICQCALDTRGTGNSLFPPIPIGFVLIVVHILLIPFTGCGVNPARTFGPSMVTCMANGSLCSDVVDGSWYWIYFIAPFLASFIVAEITFWLHIDIVDNNNNDKNNNNNVTVMTATQELFPPSEEEKPETAPDMKSKDDTNKDV
jgi:aquaporin Z